MRPLALAFREFHEVGYSFRRILIEEAAHDVTFAGFKRGVEAGLAGHGILSESSLAVGRSSLASAFQFGVDGGFVAVAAGFFAGVADLAAGVVDPPRSILT